MRSSLRRFVTCSAVAVAASVGFSGSVAHAASGVEGRTEAAARAPHDMVHFIGEALGEVSLRPDQQQAIDALGAGVRPLEARMAAARAAMLDALAADVRAGGIDRSALEPYVTDYVNAHVDLDNAVRDGIDQLHGILDASQRADFADALECRLHDARQAILSGQRVDELATALELTDAQRQHVADGFKKFLASFAPERKAIHRAIEAFREDTFSIEDVAPKDQIPVQARALATRIVDMTEDLMNILDANQRERLADRMHAAAARTSKAKHEAPAKQGS